MDYVCYITYTKENLLNNKVHNFKGYIVKSRQNTQMESTVKEGIILARTNSVRSATGMMKNSGVPISVIVRVLFQKGLIRNTDSASLLDQ